MTNALKYGKGATKIVIEVERIGSEVVATVKNNGAMIPQQAIDNLFDRFYRVEESRSQATGGTGLGLAIAQSIVALHGGYIYAKSDKQWTSFIMHLPIKKMKNYLLIHRKLLTKAEIFAILITIIRINENTEPSTLYSFFRELMAGVNQQRIIWKFQFVYVPFRNKKGRFNSRYVFNKCS